MEKKKIILDVDTGSDDAIAIMTAVKAKELDVLAITTVNGNRPVPNTTENTLRVIDLLESKIPVYRGCEEPLVAGLIPERQRYRRTKDTVEVEGKTVTYHHEYLDELPPAKSKEQNISAVRFLIDKLLNSDGDITIIAVGPLTNIATAM